jgi:hypothetical protein
METRFVLLVLLTAQVVGCKGVDCGDGTTERNGVCVPSNETIGNARCGPFTTLQGDTCVPMFEPTVCDPASTAADIDPTTGVTTCISTGAVGCSAKLPCPAPTDSSKQTICGQIYSFETGELFAQPDAVGTRCPTVCAATAGPCALAIKAFDAVTFANSGGTSGALATGDVYIDDCGRFRVSNITQPTGPLVALGFDDADLTKAGPMGISNSVGIATPKGVPATRDLEAFVVAPATAIGWATSGVPFGASNGIFAPVFRGHRTGTDVAAGVVVTRNGASDATHDYYFAAGATGRTTLDLAATMTGANGTAVYNITNPVITDLYSGTGGLPAGCVWEAHPGASVGYVVFIQIYRPTNAPSATCPL